MNNNICIDEIITGKALSSNYNLCEYKIIMSHPIWQQISNGVIHTRSYLNGLDFCMLLIRLTDKYQKELSDHDYELNMMTLVLLTLRLLDLLDYWSSYLELWNQTFNNLKIPVLYSKEAFDKNMIFEEANPFVLSKGNNVYRMHFLWTTRKRKKLIESKLFKIKYGAKHKNMLHEQQSGLSDEELQERIADIKRYFSKLSKL